MTTLQFSISINANPETVWSCLWDENNYKIWTSPFCDGSYYTTDNFKEGNKIHLLTPSGEGMYSILDKIEENKFLAFRHLGWVKDFVEQPIDEATKLWSNSMETYQLIERLNCTDLIVKVDTIDEYIEHMNGKFPLALNELKRLAEIKSK